LSLLNIDLQKDAEWRSRSASGWPYERCDAVLVMQNGSLQTIAHIVDEARTYMLANSGPRLAEVAAVGPVPVRYEK
jgi:hypothetical protein